MVDNKPTAVAGVIRGRVPTVGQAPGADPKERALLARAAEVRGVEGGAVAPRVVTARSGADPGGARPPAAAQGGEGREELGEIPDQIEDNQANETTGHMVAVMVDKARHEADRAGHSASMAGHRIFRSGFVRRFCGLRPKIGRRRRSSCWLKRRAISQMNNSALPIASC